MTIKASQVKSISEEIFEKTRANRRHIHANPELSFQEYNTQQFILDKLSEIGITNVKKIADTGILAQIDGKDPEKKVIALRADIDALPIQEANEIDYRSKSDGIMHACGHDVHTSSLLGTAEVLNRLKDRFSGSVKLLFQPGEERAPGGASVMIREGALKSPGVNQILGQHVMPFIPAGKVGFRKGVYMASADELYITIKGKGGHAAMPDRNIDPVVISASMIVQLQQLVSRVANPRLPTVLSFGKVVANGATNVIPDEVYIEGTFRTLDEKWRFKALDTIRKMATSLVEGMGATCEFNIVNGYPFLKNDDQLTDFSKAAAIEFLGEENVLDLDIWMAAEDFSFYSHEVPACFYRLGTQNESKGITSSVHTPTFDIDEDALKISPGLMAWLAIKRLGA